MATRSPASLVNTYNALFADNTSFAIRPEHFRQLVQDLADSIVFGTTRTITNLTYAQAQTALAAETLEDQAAYLIGNRPNDAARPVRVWAASFKSFGPFAIREEYDGLEDSTTYTAGTYTFANDEFEAVPGVPTWGNVQGDISAQIDLFQRIVSILNQRLADLTVGNPSNQDQGLQRTTIGYWQADGSARALLGVRWQNADNSPAAMVEVSFDGGATWTDLVKGSTLNTLLATVNQRLSSLETAVDTLQTAYEDLEPLLNVQAEHALAIGELQTNKADLVGGKVPTSQLPAVAIGERFTAASEAAMLATGAQIGDVCYRSELDKTFLCVNTPASSLSSWIGLYASGGTLTQINGQTGPVVVLAKGDLGLGNVDNTSDAAKPVSTAQQTALDSKVDKVAGKGLSANDYANTDKAKVDALGTASTRDTGTAAGQVPLLGAGGSLTVPGTVAAANVSGTNTGDQDLSGYQLLTGYHSKIASGTVALGTGSRSTTIGTGLAIQPGQRYRITSATATNYIEGPADSYNSTTGAFSLTSDDFSGAGSLGAGAIVTPAFWSDTRVLAALLTGLGAGSNVAIASTDTLLSALAKLQAQITAGTTTYGRRLAIQNGTRAGTAIITEESVHRYVIQANRLAAPVQVQIFIRMRLSGTSSKTLRVRIGNNSDFSLNSTVFVLGTTTNPSMKVMLELAWSSATDLITDASANGGYGVSTGSVQTLSANVDLTQAINVDITTQKATSSDTFEMVGFRVVAW